MRINWMRWLPVMVLALGSITNAHAASPDAQLQSGIKHYKELEFAKARSDLEAYLRTPKLAKAEQVKALRYLVICYYNEGQKSQAKDLWRQALVLDRNATLPPGQSPDVQAFFASVKPPALPAVRAAVRAKPTAPPPSGFRHTASVITLGLGVAAAGVAIAFGVLAQQSIVQAAQQDTTANAITEQNNAQTNASVATGFWIGGAALLTGGIVIFIVEAVSRPKPPTQARLPISTSTAFGTFR